MINRYTLGYRFDHCYADALVFLEPIIHSKGDLLNGRGIIDHNDKYIQEFYVSECIKLS